jgi:DNA modification methylase
VRQARPIAVEERSRLRAGIISGRDRMSSMTPYYQDESVTLWHGDSLTVLKTLPDASVDCAVTSPPYFGLRDYGIGGQYGLEASPAEYVETMRGLFADVRRVLADDGTLWLNLGDSYASTSTAGGKAAVSKTLGIRADGTDSLGDAGRERAQARQRMHEARKIVPDVGPKNLMGMPWRTAFALQDDGWILRNAVIWHKPNAMPESVTDRLSTRYEQVFLFSKSKRYWFDLDPIREPLAYPDAADGSRIFGGANKTEQHRSGPGSSARRTGNAYIQKQGHVRPQTGKEADPSHSEMSEGGRNPGDVWSINTQPFSAAHFAVMPRALAERCIQAGCKPGGVVLDPFSGSGTTGLAAARLGRRYVGIDLNAEYLDLSLQTRLAQATLDLGASA